MHVHLYTLCLDEVRMLPFFFQHYDSIVEYYVVYDDGSTDGSLDLLHQHHRVEIRPFERTNSDSFVESELVLFEHCWKESRRRADWVILVNIDEFLYHPMGWSFLETYKTKGITIIQAEGYQMVAESFPEKHRPLISQVRKGQRWAPNG